MSNTSREHLERQVLVSWQLRVREAIKSLEAYLKYTVIASRPSPRPFLDVAEPWQLHLAKSLGAMIDAAVGLNPSYTGPRNAFVCLPRGHDKSSGLGRLLNRVLRAAPVPFNGAVAAGDRDQAALLYEAMRDEARLNPWWSQDLRGMPITSYNSNSATGPGGRFRVLAANAPTEWGGRYDIVVCDEITHWQKPDMFTALWSGRHKMPGSTFVIITNAGVLRSWQHDLYLRAKDSPEWFFFEAPPYATLASWVDHKQMDEIRATLDPSEAKRVLDNCWIDPAEVSGFLHPADVDECVQLARTLGLAYRFRGDPRLPYFAGIDYGPRRDRTALSVLHPDTDAHRIDLDRLDVIQGQPGAPVRVEVVEQWIEEVGQAFGYPCFVVDPYQMEGTIQQFEDRYRVERFESRGGKSNYEMAVCLQSLITNHRLAIYEGAGRTPVMAANGVRGYTDLAQELKSLVTRPTPYGFRFDHESGQNDDMACAVGMPCLYAAREYPQIWLAPEPLVVKQKEPPSILLPEQIRIEGGPERWRIWGMG